MDVDKDIPSNCKLTFPDPKNIANMLLVIKPAEGTTWFRGTYEFTIEIDENEYPYKAPKVHCNT